MSKFGSEVKPSSSRHVLIIEDKADTRESLRLLLELLGHHVEAAGEGVEGIHKAVASRPEVAFVDIGLPGLDGYQVAKRLRAALGYSIFLIALTAYGQAEDRQRALEAGFNLHLVKPADGQELARLLAQLPRAPRPEP